MKVVELDIQMLPPTPNQLRGAHWSRKKKIRDEAGWAVRSAGMALANTGNAPPFATKPATLDVVIHAHGRAADEDNQWARCKPVIDALVGDRLLVDDSPRWLTLGSISHQSAKPRHGHLTIRITYQEGTNDA